MPSDINKTTRFEYNLDGNMVKLVAENSATGDQVTEWVYGVDQGHGSAIASKGLVRQKVYPDSTGAMDRVTYTYNRQGQVTSMKDQAATVHHYTYDKFGRLTEDAATFPSGSLLDQTVKKITRSYEVRGMLQTVSSIGGGGSVLNEVKLTYNGYGQLARDYQEHSGAVNTNTFFVGYSYADGSANTVRRTGITYPDGTTTITTAYVGSVADALSRPDALKEGSDTLCTYRYLGAGVFIGVKYDAASGVELTYEDGGSGDAGDKYTGLDRFGRLIKTLWKKGNAAQVQSQYGRNRFGGVVWRKDLTAHAQGVTTEDNFYQYDGLYQVKEHQRGNLTGTPPSGIINFQQEEDWTYDATGNWQEYSNSVPSGTEVEIGTVASTTGQVISFGHLIGTPTVTVGSLVRINSSEFTVTHIVINSPQDPVTQDGFYELTVEEDPSGVSDGEAIFAGSVITSGQTRANNQANEITEIVNPGGTLNPGYDPAGNMLTMPKAPSIGAGQYTLKWDAWNRLVEVKDGGNVVASYGYDGATRRLTKTNGTESRRYYYDGDWRAVEERVAGATAPVNRQYTWGLRDRWDLLRDKRSTSGTSLNEVHFCVKDYLDPVAIVGTDGLVKERFAYDAFGYVRFLAPDYTSHTASTFEWDFLFHAEFKDADANLYNYGYRFYDSGIGRWLSRDPIGEEGGLNLYRFASNSPLDTVDISGLAPKREKPRVDHGADGACKCLCVWITKLTVVARKSPNQKGVKESFDGTTIVVTIEFTSAKKSDSGVPDLQYWEKASKVSDQPLTQHFIKNPKPWEWYDAATETKSGRGSMFDKWHDRQCKSDSSTSSITLTDESRHFKKDSPYYHWINIVGINPPCASATNQKPFLWGGFFFYPKPGVVLHSINGGPLQ